MSNALKTTRHTQAIRHAAAVLGFVLTGAAVAHGAGFFVAIALGCASAFVVAVRYPKAGIAGAVAAVLTAQTLAQTTGMPILALADEAAVVGVSMAIVLPRIAKREEFVALRGLRWLALYVLAGAVSSVLHGVSLSLQLQDAFLFLKGPLLALAAAQLDWTAKDIPYIKRFGVATGCLVAAGGIVNIVANGWWDAHLALPDAVDVRGAIPSLIGPFVHPAPFGQFCALFGIAAATSVAVAGRGKSAAVLSAAGALLSYRRKAIVAGLAAASWTYVLARRRRVPAAVGVIVLVILGWVVFGDTIRAWSSRTVTEYVTNGSDAARTVVTRDSFRLAASEFPFGVGFARFGGHVAFTHYSPVYVALHYPSIYGLQPRGNFGTDTFWPAVLGEAGWLGVAGYVGFLVGMLRTFREVSRSSDFTRLLGLIACGWWLEFLVESIASPVYSSPPLYGVLFAVFGISQALVRTTGRDHELRHRMEYGREAR